MTKGSLRLRLKAWRLKMRQEKRQSVYFYFP